MAIDANRFDHRSMKDPKRFDEALEQAGVLDPVDGEAAALPADPVKTAPVPTPPARAASVKYQVYLPPELLERFKAQAAARHTTRAALLRTWIMACDS